MRRVLQQSRTSVSSARCTRLADQIASVTCRLQGATNPAHQQGVATACRVILCKPPLRLCIADVLSSIVAQHCASR